MSIRLARKRSKLLWRQVANSLAFSSAGISQALKHPKIENNAFRVVRCPVLLWLLRTEFVRSDLPLKALYEIQVSGRYHR
jgi:hypothetical protein